METNRAEEQEGFVRGFYGIPDAKKLDAMSFAELASELSSCAKDSPKFHVIERELKKHLAKDQARINLPNMLWAAGFGGTFALAGVVLGYYLKNDVPPTSSVQKIEKSALTPSLPSGSIPVREPAVVTLPPHPTPVQHDAEQRESKP